MGFIIVSAAQGVHFTPYHEWTYSNSDATVKTVTEPNGINDWQNHWHANDNSTTSSTYIEIAPGQYMLADSESMIQFAIETEGDVYTNNRVHLTAEAHAAVEMTTDDGIDAYAWAGSSTVAPGTATGNFYTIEADGAETIGMPVSVTIRYSIEISKDLLGGSSNSAIVDGGWSGDEMLVTVNCADLDDPQPSEIAYLVAKKDADGSYSGASTFEAAIGDVVGLHFGIVATAYTGTHPGTATGSASADVQITVGEFVFEPEMADFNSNGKVDIADLAWFAWDWLSEDLVMSDLNISGRVDITDLALFNSAWLWERPSHDTCETAYPIRLEKEYRGTTVGTEYGSVWFVFTPRVSDYYTVSMEGGSWEYYYFTIYGDCSGSYLGEIGDDHRAVIRMDGGEDYLIEIYGYEPPEDYSLFVTQGAAPPANDECGDAPEIYLYESVRGTTLGAGGEDQSSCGQDDTQDVWYYFVPVESGYYGAVLYDDNTVEELFAGTLTVYDGDGCYPLPGELACGQIYPDGEDFVELFGIWMEAWSPHLIRVGSDADSAGVFGVEIWYEGPGE